MVMVYMVFPPPQKKEEKRKEMEACENIRPAVGND